MEKIFKKIKKKSFNLKKLIFNIKIKNIILNIENFILFNKKIFYLFFLNQEILSFFISKKN
jgi:hypothetical protein